jgi:5-methylcytosine-specific restriction endonuclease McrA
MKVKCANCKEYIEKSGAISRGISNFCSMDCVFAKANKGKSSQRAGNSSKDKYTRPKLDSKVSNGKTKHRRLVSDELRQHVLEGDNYRCRLCGGNNNLALHHVIYKSNKKNKPWENQVSNLITLCNHPCHLSIVHGDKKRFQKLCLGIVWLREVEDDKHTTIYKLEERLRNV